MSSGTPISDEDEYLAGRGQGEDWLYENASKREKEYLLGVDRGEQSPPDFENCGNGLEAVHELVRRIHPPCGLRLDSAMEYWHLIDESTVTPAKAYVMGFFAVALEDITAIIFFEAVRDALAWIAWCVSSDQLEHVERFVDQHGDTWEDQRPEGCETALDVVAYLMGDTTTGSSRGLPQRVVFVPRSFPRRTEEYAADFISVVVEHLRHRQAQTPDPPRNDPPLDVPQRIEPVERQPRKIRLKNPSPEAEGHEGTSTPPAEDE